MSTLSKTEIMRRLSLPLSDEDRLTITPILSAKQLSGVSVDLRLGNQFVVFRMHTSGTVNPYTLKGAQLHAIQQRRVVNYGERFVLHPGEMVLGSTFEYLRMPNNLEAQVEGRSSWARFGLQVATATCIDPGFSGVVTLELSNVGTVPLDLFPGVRISQIIFRELLLPEARSYSKERKYRLSIGPQFSRLSCDQDAKAFIPRGR